MPTLLAGAQHPAKRLKPDGGEIAVRDSCVQGALRGVPSCRATPWAVFGKALRSSKAAMIRSRLTWLRPKERTPGVSITQSQGVGCESGSRSAMAESEICRPRPVTTFTSPIARARQGSRR